MNTRTLLAGVLAWGLDGPVLTIDRSKAKHFEKIEKRWDWRNGPTPARGSRRWKAREAYRKAIEG